jgi:hypothetical protein
MKKPIKILLWLVGIVVILLIVAVAAVKLFLPADKIRTLAVEKASAQLNRDVSVGDLDVSFWGGLGVNLMDVAVSNPGGADSGQTLTARNVDVKLRFWPLLRGEYRLDRLIINEPVIRLHKAADGSVNYALEPVQKKLPADIAEDVTPETQAAAMAVSFDRLEIRKGRVEYADDSSGIFASVFGLELSTSLEQPAAAIFHSSGEMKADSLRVVGLPGEMELPPLPVTLDYAAEYDLAGRHLRMDRTRLGLGKLEFEAEGDLNHGGPNLRVVMHLTSASIDVADVLTTVSGALAELPEDLSVSGEFTVDANLDYDDSRPDTLRYSGAVTLSGVELAKADIPGRLKFRRAIVDFEADTLRMNIEEGTFDGAPLKGHLLVEDFDRPRVAGELAGKIDLALIQPFLPAEGGHDLAGRMSFAVKFAGLLAEPTGMTISGEIDVPQATYNSPSLPEPVDSLVVTAYFDNALTRIDRLRLRTRNSDFSFTGRIGNLLPYLLVDSGGKAQAPSIDGNVKGRVDLAMLNPFLPAAGSPELAGILETDLRLAGSVAEIGHFKPMGTLSIADGVYRDSLLPEPVERFAVDLRFAPDTLHIDRLELGFVSSDVTLTGRVSDPFPYLLPLDAVDRSGARRPSVAFAWSSHRFDVDKLFPEAAPGSGVDRTALPADSVPLVPLVVPDVDGSGTFVFDTVVYSHVEFTNVRGQARIRDRKIDCYNVTSDVYTGSAVGNVVIDLNDFSRPRYTGEFNATQIEADDFVSRFSKFGGHLFGKANLQGSFDAVGLEPDSILRSLSMDGDFVMREGMLKTSGGTYQAIKALADQIGESFSEEQSLKNLQTALKVEDGKVRLDQLATSMGDIGDLVLDGYYGFDGSLDYNGSLLLTERLTQKLLSSSGLVGGLAGLLQDNSVDRVKLPVKITGTMDTPAFAVDYAALSESLGEGLKGKAEGLLDRLFKK